jgi:hypothetical protein
MLHYEKLPGAYSRLFLTRYMKPSRNESSWGFRIIACHLGATKLTFFVFIQMTPSNRDESIVER